MVMIVNYLRPMYFNLMRRGREFGALDDKKSKSIK